MKLKITTPVFPIPERIKNQYEVISVEVTKFDITRHHDYGSFDEVVPKIKEIQQKGWDYEVFWYDEFTGDKYHVEVLSD